MKRTRHTPEQIVTKLREADAMLATGKPDEVTLLNAQSAEVLKVNEGGAFTAQFIGRKYQP